MSDTRDGLEVEVNDAFHSAEWRVQRWGLSGLALLATASVLGYAGSPGTFFRVVVIYGFLLLVFRMSGKRTLAQMTSFDLVLVMVLGDATQSALIGDDFTIGTAVVAVGSLVLLDVGLGFVKSRWSSVDRLVDGLPLILVDRGVALDDRMARECVDLDDILAAGREQHGLRGLHEIDFAVLERSGRLSIVAKRRSLTVVDE